MSENHALKVPLVFGRYILLRRISRGGMGEIFLGKLGEIIGFEKPIVIKKILPELAQDRDFSQRFIEEAHIAIKLSHGNIVPVYEVGMVDNEYFLALEYVEGRDLRALLTRCAERGARLPPDLCLLLVREIANGLAYAHRRTDASSRPLDLVHCDISPPNVLVSWEGEVKIIDFGIAKSAAQRVTEDKIGFGKFGYMAPEQLLRGGVVDRRSDIYSTGVLLYELLTGQRLFKFPQGTSYRQVAREVTAGKFVAPSERDIKLSDRFDDLVMRALRTEAQERYQSAEELRDAVQQQLYSMNPTISTDSLAAFMRDSFAEEIERDQKMLRSLSRTDMASLRSELDDASSHTVSYALADLWTKTPIPGDLSAPESIPGAAARGTAPLADGGAAAGTRRLSAAEQLSAAADPSHTTYTALATPGSRTLVTVLVAVGVLVVVGIGVGLMVSSSTADPSAPPGARGAPPRSGEAAASPDGSSAAASTQPLDVPALDVAALDGGGQLTFEPERVQRTDAAGSEPVRKKHAARRRSRRRSRKGKRSRRRAQPRSKKHQRISTAMVQRKFTQVSREYSVFTRAFGKQLDGHWQKILFANTYGNMDQNKNRRLDRMLDGLRRQMKRVRSN